MRTKPFVLFLILWMAAVVIIALMTRPAAAQAGCSVRTDWPTYTVVRGDTLYRIARRYNATTTILVTANCLTNKDRIYAGQQLRVPGAGGGATLTPVPSMSVKPITFQPYEGGYLLWWAESGEIWELTGAQSGSLTTYPSRSYGGLPDNPVQDVTPPNRVRPIMGFGRLWGNFSTVRSQLGWATSSEQSFISTLIYDPVFRNYTFTIPGGRTLYSDGRTWNIFTGTIPTPPPPPPNPTFPAQGNQSVQASYQAFEHGFMIWRADTGEITVYFGSNGGGVSVFPSVSYGGLPDNVINNPPLGYFSPILGFGKVWGNFSNVRNQLGWGTTFELSYSMLITIDGTPGGFKFIVPSGRSYVWVLNDRNRTWAYTTAPDLNGAALPAVAQAVVLPTTQPSTSTPETAINTNVAYETFENGFMIWRADTGEVWVFPKHLDVSYFGQSDYQNLPDNPVTDTPPEARLAPINGFGRVWGNIAQVRNALGWALDGEKSYSATLHTIYVPSPDGVKSIPGYCFNLPDGSSVKYPQYVDSTTITWELVDSCG